MSQFQENGLKKGQTNRQKDGRREGQTLNHKTLLAMARGPKR